MVRQGLRLSLVESSGYPEGSRGKARRKLAIEDTEDSIIFHRLIGMYGANILDSKVCKKVQLHCFMWFSERRM